MVDNTFSADRPGFSPSGASKTGTIDKPLGEHAASIARDIKDKTFDAATASADTLKDQAAEMIDAAKDVASHATDKLKEQVDNTKGAGADYARGLADTMRRAAREFDGDLPIAGKFIRNAASQLQIASETVRDGNFSDLVRNAQSYARRQPTMFLGIAALAGFGIVRFLKSSASVEGNKGSSAQGRERQNERAI